MSASCKMQHIDDEGRRTYECPVCHSGEIKIPDHLFYGRCDNCNATLVDYVPLPHQEAFHLSTAQYRLNIGGFGSGKTTAACMELATHAMSTPNGRSLITAPTLSLVKDAVIPELEKFLPEWWVETSRLNPSPYYKLKNGHEIIVYSAADQQKLRSLNLTAFYIEEASGVDYEIFDQLMTRLRHKAGILRDKQGKELAYKYMGIVSTNPEEGWILDKFFLISSKIISSPSIDIEQYTKFMKNKLDRHFHTFISSTRDNSHIPSEFIERMSAGKSERWIRKYVDCQIDIQEGAVFPDYGKCLVEPREIPKSWKRLGGYDPGFRDGVANPIAAIDPKDGVIYVYDDYYVTEMPVSYHAAKVMKRTKGLEFLMPIQADPSVKKRNERDGRTYQNYFYKLTKIFLEPGNNDILYGIEKVRDYMQQGKLKFFNNLENMKNEAKKYKFPDDKTKNTNEKPMDKHNHLWDAIRYMIAACPEDPTDMETIYVQRELHKTKAITSAFMDDIYEKDEYSLNSGGVFGGMKL